MPSGKKNPGSNACLGERLENWRQSTSNLSPLAEAVEKIQKEEEEFEAIGNLPIPSTSNRSSLTLAMEMSPECKIHGSSGAREARTLQNMTADQIAEIRRRNTEIENAVSKSDSSSQSSSTMRSDMDSGEGRNKYSCFANCLKGSKVCCVCDVKKKNLSEETVAEYLTKNPRFLTTYVVDQVSYDNILCWSRIKTAQAGAVSAPNEGGDAVVATTSGTSGASPLNAGDSPAITFKLDLNIQKRQS